VARSMLQLLILSACSCLRIVREGTTTCNIAGRRLADCRTRAPLCGACMCIAAVAEHLHALARQSQRQGTVAHQRARPQSQTGTCAELSRRRRRLQLHHVILRLGTPSDMGFAIGQLQQLSPNWEDSGLLSVVYRCRTVTVFCIVTVDVARRRLSRSRARRRDRAFALRRRASHRARSTSHPSRLLHRISAHERSQHCGVSALGDWDTEPPTRPCYDHHRRNVRAASAGSHWGSTGQTSSRTGAS